MLLHGAQYQSHLPREMICRRRVRREKVLLSFMKLSKTWSDHSGLVAINKLYGPPASQHEVTVSLEAPEQLHGTLHLPQKQLRSGGGRGRKRGRADATATLVLAAKDSGSLA